MTAGRGLSGGSNRVKVRMVEGVAPHDLHVGVILSSEEAVAAVRPDHVSIHCELHFSPELAVLLWAHGQSARHITFRGGGHLTGKALHRG